MANSSRNSERSALLPTACPDETPSRDQECTLPIMQDCALPNSCFGLFPLAPYQKVNALVHHDDEAPSDESSSTDPWIQAAQYVVSVALLGLCTALITAGILFRQTPVSADMSLIPAIVLMWALMWWLGILEGTQGCLVGLQPIHPDEYRDTHPYTYKCTQLAHSCDNLNRFIVGRQFLVVLMVFLLNLVCTAVEDSRVPGIPPALFSGLVASGLAVMIITVMLGQLSAEVNATNCMFDFVNSRVVYVTTWMCLAIEESGLLHSVYLVQSFFGFFCPEAGAGGGGKKSLGEQVWYWTRMAASVALLGAALVVTCAALWHDETTMVPSPNTIASFAVFFGLVVFLGILEALQIAAFAVVKLPPHVVAENPAAEETSKLVFKGRNFKAVLIGRQILVTTSMFFLARITTTCMDPKDLAGTSTMSAILGAPLPPAIQAFFNTGLPGALITTIVASLWWRIAAASFPIAFMASPVIRWTVQLCLFLESTGVFSASLLLSDALRWMMGLQPDEEHAALEEASEEDLECGKDETSTLVTRATSSYTNLTDDFNMSSRSKTSTILTKTSSVINGIRSDISLTVRPEDPSMSDGDTIRTQSPSDEINMQWLVGNIQELDRADMASVR